MGTFVQDSFTDSDSTSLQSHTGEAGAAWTKISGFTGDATINTNQLINSTVEAAYYASGAPASADYEVSADYSWTNSQYHNFKVCGRVDTSTGDHYTLHYSRSDAYFRLQKHVGGTTTTLATSSGQHNINEGVSRNHKLTLSGTALEGFKDGTTSVVSTTDASITAAGRAGLRLSGNSTTRLRIDNFLATEAGGDTAISPANASHGHSATDVTLTQAHEVPAQGATHGHTAAEATLAQMHGVVIQGGTHSHGSENATIASSGVLDAANGAHAQAADSCTLQQVHGVAVQAADHAHAGEAGVLHQEHSVVIQGAEHGHVGASVSIAPGVTVQGAAHGHSAETATVAETEAALAIADAVHAQSAELVTLAQVHLLMGLGSGHSHAAGNVVLFGAAPVFIRARVGVEASVLAASPETRMLGLIGETTQAKAAVNGAGVQVSSG